MNMDRCVPLEIAHIFWMNPDRWFTRKQILEILEYRGEKMSLRVTNHLMYLMQNRMLERKVMFTKDDDGKLGEAKTVYRWVLDGSKCKDTD